MFICRLVGVILAAMAASAFAVPAQASAVVYHVTSSADNGPNTLRQAVIDGNALSAIEYPDIRIDLDSSQPILLTSPLPIITKQVFKLRGTAPTAATINGQQQFRSLHFNSGGFALITVDHLRLVHGQASSRGGCILLEDENGAYSLTDVDFYQCQTENSSGDAHGAAIWMEGGSLTIRQSSFRANWATGEAAFGGAISLWQQDATLLVEDSSFYGNIARSTDPASGKSRGGAIRAGLAELTIRDSVFLSNHAMDATGSGGNRSDYYGGAIYSERGHGAFERNLFVDNGASDGGAVLLTMGLDGDHTQGYQLINNTFVANHVNIRGGAVRDWNVDLVLRNNSFFANTSDGGSSIVSFGSTASVGFWNNLFASEPGGNWCETSANTVLSSQHNLIPSADCGFSGSNNRVNSDLLLQGFRLGPVHSSRNPLSFFADSPALDAGYPGPPDDTANQACPMLDGFGNPRVVDGDVNNLPVCDIGAFEWQHEAPLFADDFENRIQPAQP